MAITKTVLKNTNQETVVKLVNSGAGDQTMTIDLQTDCLAATQALDGATQRVNIIGMHWAGLANSHFHIDRNAVSIFGSDASQPTQFEFEGMGFVENVNNSYDIDFTMNGEAYIYIVLRKVEGYATKVETAQFGIYDNQSVVGS